MISSSRLPSRSFAPSWFSLFNFRNEHALATLCVAPAAVVPCIHPARPIQPCPAVKFHLIDKIEALSDERIVAVKYVSLAEEYLADHFPTFPVLPGVMMLEALTQAAAWLLHRRSGFGKSIAVLKEAKNLRYGHFVAPGNALRVEVDFVKSTEAGGLFKCVGTVDGEQALTGRLELAYFNLGDKQPDLAATDAKLIEHHRHRWQVLTGGAVESW